MDEYDPERGQTLGPCSANIVLAKHLEHARSGITEDNRANADRERQRWPKHPGNIFPRILRKWHVSKRLDLWEVNGAKDHDQSADKEIWRGYAEQRDDASEEIDHAPAPNCAEDAERHSNQNCHRHCHGAHFKGRRQTPRYFSEDRAAMNERVPEVTTCDSS